MAGDYVSQPEVGAAALAGLRAAETAFADLTDGFVQTITGDLDAMQAYAAGKKSTTETDVDTPMQANFRPLAGQFSDAAKSVRAQVADLHGAGLTNQSSVLEGDAAGHRSILDTAAHEAGRA